MRGTAALWIGAVAVLMAVVGSPAAELPTAETPPPVEIDGLGTRFSLLPPGEPLALEDTATAVALPDLPVTPKPRPDWLLTSLVSGGAVLGATLNSVFDGNHQAWHFGNEGWFGRNTHFGGADKGAHFSDYYIISKEFANIFVMLGHKPENARWLAAGVATFTGLVNEIGDGQNKYGFSYEDLVMDTGGALAAALINAFRVEDLLGVRRGFVNFDDCCNYSNEIYTADLHLSGVARRLGINIGPLKYLLLSVTYGTTGYPDNPARTRDVGVEVGLDFRQILNDLNVTRRTWWGYGLHVLFDNFRLPYTAVGYRFDMNAGRWHGPNAGH